MTPPTDPSDPSPFDLPLVTHIHTADPSAHVFNGTLYIYPSHDIPTATPFNDSGDQYAMTDYHILSLPSPSHHPATDHGVALSLSSVPWASQQLWAPDAAEKDGTYFLYFPARAHDGRFKIGVAVSASPTGPFVAEPEPIPGAYSIDPAAFVDPADGRAYLYFGGLWGGQLQCWDEAGTTFDETQLGPHEPSGVGVAALCPRVAELRDDMLGLVAPARELQILAPETGEPIQADDHERRFFEAAWMHKRGGVYYFSYSTGDTHRIVYATGGSAWGPFTYKGVILGEVRGWTTHHSIVEWEGRWWLFYHDCEMSGGVDHLRSVKMREIFYDGEGNIRLEKS